MGKGSEDATNYKGTRVKFADIENIHAVRESYIKLMRACASSEGEGNWFSAVSDSQWLHHIRSILESAVNMVRIFEDEGASIVCHCSDGSVFLTIILNIDTFQPTIWF